MSRTVRIGIILLCLLAGLFLVWGLVLASPTQSAYSDEVETVSLPTPTPLPNRPASVSPDISFIDSPTATCTLPEAHTGVCLMTWYYMYADASPNYIITMTVGIDDKARAHYTGFFQTDMYVPTDMLAFQVPCGAPGAGGNPNFGAVHSYVLKGRDSAGSMAANNGTVFCPADILRAFLPITKR